MKCSKVVDLLGKYLDKELPQSEAAEVYNHLLTCQSCSREFRALKRERDIVKQVFARTPFDSKLSDAIYERLLWRGTVVLPRRRPPVLIRYAPLWAACAAAVLIAVILLYLPEPPVTSTEYTVAKVREGSSLSVLHPSTGERRQVSGNCDLQALAYRFGMMAPRFPYQWLNRETDGSAPKIIMEHNRCIQCQRCVRAIKTKDGRKAFAVQDRSGRTKIWLDPELAAKLSNRHE
jgi:ferredoxin